MKDVACEAKPFDIAIVGGGMVGASMASLLSASLPHLQIALIESQALVSPNLVSPTLVLTKNADLLPSFDARSTALSYGSTEIFRELGIWTEIQKHVTAIKQVHVSDRGHLLGGEISAEENNLAAVGYVVENRWLGRVLSAHLHSQKNIQCFYGARVAKLTPIKNATRLEIENSNSVENLIPTPKKILIEAALTIIADGGESPLRKALGISTQVRDYQQTAIVTNIEFSAAHEGIAYERFTAEGPIALLPLGESPCAHQASLVWTLPKSKAASVFALNDAEFLAKLQQAFGFRAGLFERVATRHIYPLQLVLSEEQIRSRLVLLGNAAHFLHPVAGQGFNLALRDCVCLVETLKAAADKSQDLGELSVLRTYLEHQIRDQQITIGFSDKLVGLFSNNNLPQIVLRHLGLLSLELFPLLKKTFSAQTMGTASRKARWLPHALLDEEQQVKTEHIKPESIKPEQPKSEQKKTSPAFDARNEQKSSSAVDADIIIIGAGIVGSALACTIAGSELAKELRIVVIEASVGSAHFSGTEFDPRVVALTQRSKNLLTQVGCWDAIATERVCAYREMKVWDGEGTASISFDGADVHQPELGHIVENSVVVNALHARMNQFPQIEIIQPEKLVNFFAQSSTTPPTIELSNGKKLSAHLIVAADGAASSLRNLAGFATREWDYDQQAIVTSVRTEKSHDYTAWQRFMHTGPLAFLPLRDGNDSHWCSIVWSADNKLAEELMALDDATFCARLTSAFEARLGVVLSCAQRFAIPLRQRHAKNYIQLGVVLVGDAAHSIHPLAGQGVNLGLLDVAALVQEIERGLARNLSIADYSILRRYQRARLADNLRMMSAMELFNALFGNRSLTINWLRNFGMRRLNSMTEAKKIIINAVL